MTMNLHTPTTAPKAAPATSVSPLEQSGSPKTKFPEIKTVKTAVVKLISDIEGNLDQRLAYREAVEGLCQEAANRITQCMHSRSTGQTLRDLRELLSVTLDTIIVVEFEGEQTRLNYGGRSAEDVIAMLKALHLEGAQSLAGSGVKKKAPSADGADSVQGIQRGALIPQAVKFSLVRLRQLRRILDQQHVFRVA
ncbi:Uncharacterised protein [Kluyvera cryocrescens]|uniref:Uncharacterized protein n=3 Tax=Enterobacteriaceae TaxID=543 RepID=A0A485C597_KLUCR|nr:Uncharacterised protein [Kluyvera cryocrescens]